MSKTLKLEFSVDGRTFQSNKMYGIQICDKEAFWTECWSVLMDVATQIKEQTRRGEDITNGDCFNSHRRVIGKWSVE